MKPRNEFIIVDVTLVEDHDIVEKVGELIPFKAAGLCTFGPDRGKKVGALVLLAPEYALLGADVWRPYVEAEAMRNWRQMSGFTAQRRRERRKFEKLTA